ncbi:MAG: efflux RND transporter permease subunit [Proteobacteria bacterium]|nr:efflux RND transporter permease subunit [Pseudomonadota bacterium]
MRISEIAIKNHVFAWMLMAGLIIFGGMSFLRMGVSQLPDVDFPTVTVGVSLDGASPEVMELDVVDVIESGLTSVPGIKAMSSTSRTGSASITIEFGLDKDIDVVVQEVQTAISRVQRRLPADIDAPTVRKSNPEDQPILWLGVSADSMDRKQLMALVRDQVQDRFSTLDGVGEITLGGYFEPNLRVWLNQEKLNYYQLTAADVLSAIKREHSELPGGRIETTDQEINVRTMGEAPTVADFENIAITRRGGAVNFAKIALKDIAKVEEGTADVRSLSRAQGKVTVGMGIRKQPGSNAVEVAKSIKSKISEIATQLPKGVEIGVRFDNTIFIEEAVGELNFTLIFSAILTAIVCWMFLGSWSATINVILAIPTSVVGCFIVLNMLGFTLNTFTLLGLSLAIGIVVDDAIMVLENIVRHKEMGKSRLNAALHGSVEITTAAIAATIAIIAIFLPVAFMDGVIGKYFLQFGITLSVAVAISLLEALTLTPMRCSKFLSVEPRRSLFGRFVEGCFLKSAQAYRFLIPFTLRHPWLTIFAASLFFAGTWQIGSKIKREFVPAQDQSRLMVRLQTPVGSSLGLTDAKVKEVEDYFATRTEIISYFGSVGGFGGSGVNSGMIFLTLKSPKERKQSAQELANAYRQDLKKIKGVRSTIQDPSLAGLGGGGRSFPIDYSIRGNDWDTLVATTKKIAAEMEKTGQMTDVDTNYLEGMPEIQIIPDRIKARQYGVDVADISQTINVMIAGTVAAKFSKGGRRFDVRMSLPPEDKSTSEVIKQLKIRNNTGELIPLKNLVTIENRKGLQSISREDRQRAINVRANVGPKSSQAEAMNITKDIIEKNLPSGYTYVVGGSAKTFKESFSSLIIALLLGILVSYMVLASQFNSFVDPITILIALPFSVSGAFIALYLGGQTLNIYSMIGLILLMGIVKKNSILLVEFTNQVRETGKSVQESLTEACPVRLRPILMTSFATVAGAIPPALAIGPGAESRIPMALAVIGGVLVSTVLTLFVVPSVYLILSKLQKDRQDHAVEAK